MKKKYALILAVLVFVMLIISIILNKPQDSVFELYLFRTDYYENAYWVTLSKQGILTTYKGERSGRGAFFNYVRRTAFFANKYTSEEYILTEEELEELINTLEEISENEFRQTRSWATSSWVVKMYYENETYRILHHKVEFEALRKFADRIIELSPIPIQMG